MFVVTYIPKFVVVVIACITFVAFVDAHSGSVASDDIYDFNEVNDVVIESNFDGLWQRFASEVEETVEDTEGCGTDDETKADDDSTAGVIYSDSEVVRVIGDTEVFEMVVNSPVETRVLRKSWTVGADANK